MCLNNSERDDIVKEAKTDSLDLVRGYAWQRAKTELKIMISTLVESDAEIYVTRLNKLVDEFIQEVESNCYHQ